MNKMSFCKTTRRAPIRKARPFIPELPLTSLIYEAGNYYAQQNYSGLNLDDEEPSGNNVYLYKISSSGVNEQPAVYQVNHNGVFSAVDNNEFRILHGGRSEDGKKAYFWNNHLLFFLKRNVEGGSDSVTTTDFFDKIGVIFQLCNCQNCRKRPGVPLQSLMPLSTEMSLQASAHHRDPPRFGRVPVILKPAILTHKLEESFKSCVSKSNLVSPQRLVYFVELYASQRIMDGITLDQLVFDEMAVKLVQIITMEAISWASIKAPAEIEKSRLKNQMPTATLAAPLSPSKKNPGGSSLRRSNPDLPTPPFSGISAVSDVSPPTKSIMVVERSDEEEEEEDFSVGFMERMKRLAGVSAEPVPVKRPTLCLKTMLEEEVNTDWEIISTDGKVVRCHLAVLATQVPFFRSLAEEWSSPGPSGFAMPPDTEMDETCVRAFLRFIYMQETEMMKASFPVCFTLLRAGHWHQLSSLVMAASDIIMKRGYRLNRLGWFTVDGLWRLFEFVQGWDDKYAVKTELVNAIVDVLKILIVKGGSKTSGLLKITNGDSKLADLIFGFLTR